MNPFEKIFNYQIISRLHHTGDFALTAQERSWLKTMLEHETAENAFAPHTLSRMKQLLSEEVDFRLQDIIIEKGKNRQRHVYHPLLRQLRRHILEGIGVKVDTRLKNGETKTEQTGIPYKLEYSMVKREWSLLWYSTRRHSLMSTKLHNITALQEWELSPESVEAAKSRMQQLLAGRVRKAVVEVMPAYHAELSRILSAFSCFDKTVQYDEETWQYRIHIQYLADEAEYLLSKIRFLGLRVKVAEGDYFIKRMLEASTKALMRYEIEPEGQAPQPKPVQEKNESA
ncbi:WYL domain-containing protein [Paenibacillus sp. GCM10027627]|uniref:WYL domain-containing protein n=1 Tax=unclassified Paenibacillus TaxID=185978 RepID=UPI00363FD74A